MERGAKTGRKRQKEDTMKRLHRILLASALCGLGCSCSAVYEDLAPCEYSVSFVYDYNMAFADAFPSTSVDVSLYVFDADSTFLTTYTGQAEDYGGDGYYTLPVPLPAGTYHLVAWGGHTPESFETTELMPGTSKLEDLSVRLRGMQRESDGQTYWNKPLNPLLHGQSIFVIDSFAHSHATVHLMNNTKTLGFLIQTEGGDTLSPEQFHFDISVENAWMNHGNELLEGGTMVYGEHFKSHLTPGEGVDVLKAEVHTLRLMADQPARLRISSGMAKNELLDIDLVSYLIMFKSIYYQNMEDQEWLDRNNSFNIVFFMNQNTGRISSLQIGPWKVRLEDMQL